MRFWPVILLAVACGNENKLADGADVGGLGDGTAVGDDGTTTPDGGPGDDDDGGNGGPNTGGTDTGEWTDTGSWGECEWAAHVAGYLDQFQTPGDGKVFYCHNDGGPHYVYQASSTDACLTHIGHSGDIFPTTICDS